MGTKRTPTAVRVLQGNPGKRPYPKDEPTYQVVLCEPPKGISPQAAFLWRQMMPLLTASRVMTEADVQAFGVLCETGARWHYAVEKSWEGMIYFPAGYEVDAQGKKVPKGAARVNPYVKIAEEAGREYRRLLAEFGLTPSSRAGVAKAGADDDDNPFSNL